MRDLALHEVVMCDDELSSDSCPWVGVQSSIGKTVKQCISEFRCHKNLRYRRPSEEAGGFRFGQGLRLSVAIDGFSTGVYVGFVKNCPETLCLLVASGYVICVNQDKVEINV